ncbi:helix-turn-helix domain-containing protein [Paenibacillus aestuarii]|uniref:Helix-turn-helix transcriptional regulator n=1 Tax=Paenibacillus aestuarii TaxID=516965 RepID=A0ABW0K4M4_9BACL|nr:helix-turn-helix transcriptional regulator [Paenibacillus aestuarii]
MTTTFFEPQTEESIKVNKETKGIRQIDIGDAVINLVWCETRQAYMCWDSRMTTRWDLVKMRRRQTHGLTQVQFAAKFDLPTNVIKRLESPYFYRPQQFYVYRIQKVLGRNFEWQFKNLIWI